MNTALYCIGTKRPSAREPETALFCIGTKRPRRRCTEKARVPETRRDARDAREPNGNPMGDSASDGDAQSEGQGVQRGEPASRGWYSCVRPRSPRSAHT